MKKDWASCLLKDGCTDPCELMEVLMALFSLLVLAPLTLHSPLLPGEFAVFAH